MDNFQHFFRDAQALTIFRNTLVYVVLAVTIQIGLAVLAAFAPLAVLAFNAHRNEFFRPLVFLSTHENFTIPLGVFTLKGI